MSVSIVCPNPACGKAAKGSVDLFGRNVRCKHCGQQFVAQATVDHSAADTAPASGRPSAATAEPRGPIGRFTVRQRLGAGAFGVVYRAYDPQLDREVALKVPNAAALDTPRRVERFLREAKAAANLRHPHIVPVYDAGRDGGQYFIASAFIAGKKLSDTIDDDGVPFDRAARLARELAEALAYAHGEGVVHRDVKPDNIMLDAEDRVHLMDFGLAARQDEESKLTNDGAVMGTPSYMAPEQAQGQQGEAKPAADQYSAGIVLYELLTGRVPFSGPPAVVIHNQIHTEPERPSTLRAGIPKDLETICLKALSKDSADRYADCQALADDLRRWREGEPIAARRLSAKEQLVRWVKRNRAVAALSTAVAAALVVGVAVSAAFAVRAGREADRADREASAARDALGVAKETAAREEIARKGAEAAVESEKTARAQAEEEKRKAVEAGRVAKEQEAKAVAAGKTADAEKKKAERSADEALRAGYGSRLTLAYLQAESGRSPEAVRSLAACPTDHRGWEWEWLSGWAGGGSAYTDSPAVVGPAVAAAVSGDGEWVAVLPKDPARDLVVYRRTKPNEGIAVPGTDRSAAAAVALSPDGDRVAFIADRDADSTVLALWSVAAKKELWRRDFPSPRETSLLVFAPDGRTVALGGTNGGRPPESLVFDAATGEPLLATSQVAGYSPSDGLTGYLGGGSHALLGSVVFDLAAKKQVDDFYQRGRISGTPGFPTSFAPAASPGDRWIAAGTARKKSITLVDWTSRRSTNTAEFIGVVRHVGWLAENRVAGMDEHGTVKLFDPAVRQPLIDLPGAKPGPLAFRAATDGSLTAVYQDGTARRWAKPVGSDIVRLKAGVGTAGAVQFGPDGTSLTVAGTRGVATFSWPDGKETGRIAGPPDARTSLMRPAFSPDRTSVAVRVTPQAGNREYVVYDLRSGGATRRWPDPAPAGFVADHVWSADGKAVYHATRKTNGSDQLLRKDLTNDDAPTPLPLDWWSLARATHGGQGAWGFKTGRKAAAGVSWEVARVDGKQPAAGPLEFTLPSGEAALSTVRVSPAADRVCVPFSDGQVFVYDVKARKVVPCGQHATWLLAVAFDPKGAWMATGGGDEQVRFCDPRSGKALRTLAGTGGGILDLAVSPDGRWLAAATAGDAVVWDLERFPLVPKK